MVERGEGLVDDPELDLAGEVKGRDHGGGEELDEEAVEGGEEVEVTAGDQELLRNPKSDGQAGVDENNIGW